MAPKQRPSSSAQKPQSVLLAETLQDLKFLEPIRTRDRVISIFEELFVRLNALERIHNAEARAKGR